MPFLMQSRHLTDLVLSGGGCTLIREAGKPLCEIVHGHQDTAILLLLLAAVGDGAWRPGGWFAGLIPLALQCPDSSISLGRQDICIGMKMASLVTDLEVVVLYCLQPSL